MEYYQNDNKEYIIYNEPSSSHCSVPKALKRAPDNIMTKSAKKQCQKKEISQLNNACNTLVYTHSKIPSPTNENIVQAEKYSKPNDLVARALQCIMSKMGTRVKQYVSGEHFKRKFVKKKLYDLFNRRILGMPTVKTLNSYKDIVEQYNKVYPFSKDKDVMRIFKEQEEFCPDVIPKSNNEYIVNTSSLPHVGKIFQIFETKLDESLAVNMLGMIKNVGNYYQNERNILQCIDELPDMNNLSDKEKESGMQEGNINISENELQMTDLKLLGKEDNPNKISEAENKVLSEYYKIIDCILTPRILQYLHKYKHDFEQMLNYDKDYVEAKSKIMTELRDKIKDSLDDMDDMDDDVEIISVEDDVISINSDTDDEAISIAKEKENIPEPNTEFRDSKKDKTNNVIRDVSTTSEVTPLLVKLIGNPKLPPRPILRTFLNKFNPAFIKQHKTVDNVLVIGINNKQDYNNIIEANKSKVGNSTMIIIDNVKQKTKDNKIDKNHDSPKEIASDATQKNEEIVIDSPKRTGNNMELDEVVVIDDDDDDDDDDVVLIEVDTKLTFERDTEKKEKRVTEQCTDATVSSGTNTTPRQTNLKFLTMLIGRPTLPEKVFMDEFLSRFNPVSIKRHKVVNNVLLVGFNTRKDYDNILAANESKVGSSIFIIKPKDVNSPGKQDNNSLPNDDSYEITTEKIKFKEGIDIVNSEYDQEVEENKNNEMTKKVNMIHVDSSSTENNLVSCTDSKREQIPCCQQEDLKKSEIDEVKSYLEANVGGMMNKIISETISKVGQFNKQSGSKFMKCNELEAKNGAKAEANENVKELDSEINVSDTDEYNNEVIKKMAEETFFKKLNFLEDHMVSILHEDEEYDAVKSIILKNVESMKKSKESRVESNSDYENINSKNRLRNSKDMDKIPKDVEKIVTDNLLENSIEKPSNVDSLNYKDRINDIEGNLSASKDVFVEHDDSQKVQDNSKTTLNPSDQNVPNTLNSIPIVDKNDNIPNNLHKTESLNHESQLKSKDEKIDKEKQTNEYEVRLLGLPKLPSNELLRGFLNKYNIRYKKKHKMHGNLLVIGMADKTQYHNILSMDGKSIGDVKFIIRPSV